MSLLLTKPKALKLFLLTAVSLLWCQSLSAIVIVEGVSVRRHERFANDTQFLGNVEGVDFAGVGRTAAGRWVTMISARHFLTAGHTAPASGELVEFRFDNSTSAAAPQAVCAVATSQQVGNGPAPPTDLRVGELDPASCVFSNTLLSTLPFYKIAELHPLLPDPFVGAIVLQVGTSETTFGGSRLTSFRVGRNRVSRTTTDEVVNISPLGDRQADWAYYADDSLEGDENDPRQANADMLQGDETYFEAGDSGAPSFLLTPAGPQLFGIHSFTGGELTFANGDRHRASGDVLLTRYRSQIQQVTAVPEPAPWLLMLLVFSLLGAWRRFRPAWRPCDQPTDA